MLRMLLISVIRVGIVRQGFAGGSREQSARKAYHRVQTLAVSIGRDKDTSTVTTTMCQKPIIVRPSSTVQRKTRSGCQAHDVHQQRVRSRKEKAAFFQSHHRIVLYSMT
ncbi:unnamed protein product, partial [Musa acuminata subsp. burmannicoides]